MAEVESFQLEFERDVTPRVERRFQAAVEAQAAIDIGRARYFTESWKETEGEPICIRRAKAYDNVLKKMDIYIQDGELIVGNVAFCPRGSVICPEYSANVFLREFVDDLQSPETRPYDKHIFDPEVKRELLEEIFPYWADKTVAHFSEKELSQETIDHAIPSLSRLGITVPPGTEIHLNHGMGHMNVRYDRVMQEGARGIIEDVAARLQRETDQKKKDFYQSIILCFESFVRFANRYAVLARQMAETEQDSVRKQELLEIAATCEHVPEYPARTFREAVQAFWFTQIFLFGIEQDDTACSPGRMDQYLYPYYQMDRKNGTVTDADIQEIINLLFIKFAEMSVCWDYSTAKYYAGFSLTQTLIVGGVDRDGNDATNELSYMFLEAEKQVPLFQPEFAARIHKNSPFAYFLKLAEVSRLGHGKPKMFVDDTAIPALMSRGISLEDARDYCIVGCVEPSPSGNMAGWTNACQFNLAKCMELALTEGVCLISGEQIGIKTPPASEMKSIEDVIDAFHKQVEYFVYHTTTAISTYVKYHGKYVPNMFTSALLDGCLESGMDLTEGGAKYSAIGINGVATPDVGDSLAAIEKCVFEDGLFTLEEVAAAMRKNFEGYEEMRDALLHKAPKYGNDEDFVDRYVRLAGQIWCSEVKKYQGPHGERYWPGTFTVSSNVPYGLNTGALPSGRLATEPLANGGISATNGSDMNGPTALIKSASKLDHVAACNGTLLNMRFSPNVLKEDRDIAKFANFLRTYCLLGGYHVQFNVISSKLLKKAQATPEKYRNLLVRVAGYSAYFTELSKDVQDDLINRTVYNEV